MDFSYLLQFAVTSSGSHFDEAGFVDFDDEASAALKMENFAEPLQTFYFTPAVMHA